MVGKFLFQRFHRQKMVDLAEAMAPGKPLKSIGIRPGEKLHEVMCPLDDSHLTLDFLDHYVIMPSINFHTNSDYSENRLGEKGVPVQQGFEYNSGTNPDFLNATEMRAIINNADSE